MQLTERGGRAPGNHKPGYRLHSSVASSREIEYCLYLAVRGLVNMRIEVNICIVLQQPSFLFCSSRTGGQGKDLYRAECVPPSAEFETVALTPLSCLVTIVLESDVWAP